MGFGDVRLSFVLGLFLGWLGWGDVFGGLFAGFLYGAVIGVVLIAVEVTAAASSTIPFGPFLAAGTMTFVLFGEPDRRLVARPRSLTRRSGRRSRRKAPRCACGTLRSSRLQPGAGC